MKLVTKLIIYKLLVLLNLFFSNISYADNHNIYETLEIIKNDLKTLERAVYSGSVKIETASSGNSNSDSNSNSEDVLTRHLLKLSEVENQFRELTNKFEEINFKLDKLSNRLSKIQADNQIRFQDIEVVINSGESTTQLTSKPKTDASKDLPGSSQPQDLGSISYKDTETSETSQQIQSVETTGTIVTETFQSEEKILPQDLSPEKQYEFATSFLKVGDYSTAEIAFREFVLSNSDHDLAGSAQYWYAETFRIRQLYTDAASAYLEGYQKYPKGKKAPINLLKLGVSMVQIGEKDQGCKMISGVELQYPEASQSVIQKAKYESKKFECIKQDS
ncbi:tol-pal system protein YbgF [Candidatus Pelagibacter bacterium]|nr:tol-pal system protein YbgF [Candidatus Pelagibacter bacterium]